MTNNPHGLSTGQLFSAAARQLNEQAKVIDAERKRPPATAAEQQMFAGLTTDAKMRAAFAGRDPADLLADQPGGPVPQPEVTPTLTQTTDQRFREAFGKRDDTTPPATVPPAANQLEPAPVAAADDRKRTQDPLPEAAESLFTALQQRLQAPPAAPVDLPPDAVMRQALHRLSGPQRDAIEEKIQRENFMSGWYAANGYSPSYRTTLTADALAQRLVDAQRLDPTMTADGLLSRMISSEALG